MPNVKALNFGSLKPAFSSSFIKAFLLGNAATDSGK